MKLPRLPNPAVARGHYQHMYLGSLYTADQMKAYAQKCVAEEKEACAKVCIETGATKGRSDDGRDMADHCAAAIRARGQE